MDTAAYQVGLKRARNCIIHPYGGVSNRPGLLFCGPVKDHDYAPRLITFKYKTDDQYVLEFGDGYMRVMRNDEHVTEASKNISAVAIGNPVVVTSAAHGYSNGDEVFIEGVGGTTEINGRRFLVANKGTDTFELADQVDGAIIDGSAYSAYTSGGTVARIYAITTPYAYADLDNLKFVQSADVMTLTHKGYAMGELRRTDHNAWTLTEPTFAPSQAGPTSVTVTPDSGASTTVRYRVTALSDEGEESLPGLISTTKNITGITKANPAVVTSAAHGYLDGDEVYITGVVGMTELNGRRFIVAGKTTDTYQLRDEDSSDYTAYTSGGTTQATFVRITNSASTFANTVAWTAASGAVKYSIYREKSGIFGFIGESESTSFKDDNFAPDLDVTPPSQRNPFRGSGNQPGTVSYYEQRRVFGGSDEKPDTTEYSVVGSANNMSKSSPGQDDDAITATLNAQEVNEIRHFVPLTDLLVLTSGSEWRVNSGQDGAFAASTLKQKPQSYWGCSHTRPLVAGNTVLFVQEGALAVRSLGYSFSIDSYTGNEMSLLANHLFESYGIRDWAYARVPEPIIHIVREDGAGVTFTFNQEQEVIAWTPWDTSGKFERVTVARSSADASEDSAYFVVRRIRGDGTVVRYIERTHSRRFTDVRDCFFVDSGLSYDSPITITNITLGATTTITAAAHGLSNGDYVDLFDIEWVPDVDEFFTEEQPDQLNRRRYKVANKTTDTFEIVDADDDSAIDSSDYSAYVEGGTVRKAVSTLTGYWHLEGRTLVALCDGNVVEDLVVEDGQIDLGARYSRVHAGLRFVTDIETLSPEAPAGTIQGKLKKIGDLTIRFLKSRGLLIGNDETDLIDTAWRENEDYGDPTALFTGDKGLPPGPDWNTHGRVFMRQKDPLPVTILSIIPEITIGEDVVRSD